MGSNLVSGSASQGAGVVGHISEEAPPSTKVVQSPSMTVGAVNVAKRVNSPEIPKEDRSARSRGMSFWHRLKSMEDSDSDLEKPQIKAVESPKARTEHQSEDESPYVPVEKQKKGRRKPRSARRPEDTSPSTEQQNLTEE
jgi:hypothetical protein